MIFPQWTLGNIILYGYLAFLTLAIVPMELRGMAMMEYSKFRGSKGISSRTGMLLIYGLPLLALLEESPPTRSQLWAAAPRSPLPTTKPPTDAHKIDVLKSKSQSMNQRIQNSKFSRSIVVTTEEDQ